MADALARVPPGAAAGTVTTAHVHAARGEFAGLPVVVRAPAAVDLTSLDVGVSALACTEGPCRGKVIGAQYVDAYRAMVQTVSTPSGRGDRAYEGRTDREGPAGANTLSDPGAGSMCGRGRPLGEPPCLIPDGLIPYKLCSDGSAPPCARGDGGRPNACAVDGTACGGGAPSMTVARGTNQQLWVEIRIPTGQAVVPAGTYSGALTIAANRGRLTARVGVSVAVWDFDVPQSPSFKTAFGLNGGAQPSAFYNGEAQEMFAKHKVSLPRYGGTSRMGVDDWPEGARNYGEMAARLRRRWGVPNALEVGWSHGVSGATCKTSWSASDYASTGQLEGWVRTHGLPTAGVLLYAHNGDEVNSGLAEAGYVPYGYSSQRACGRTCGWCTYRYMREAARAAHRTGRVKVLSVVDPNPYLVRETDDLTGTGRPAVDVFVVSPHAGWSNPTAIASVRGNAVPSEMWTYNIWVGDRYSPKWQLDYSPVAYRLGFVAQALGVSGAAVAEIADNSYPGCDAGSACRGGRSVKSDDPWTQARHLYKNVCDDGRPTPPVQGPNCATNGDSQWFYTGSQVGLGRWSVVPHLRLKFLRDGIQDYELVQILKEISGGSGYATGTCPGYAVTCKALVEELGGTDWSDYSTDVYRLQRVREAIGDKIAADPRRPLRSR